MTTRETLIEARKLIEKPENWAANEGELVAGRCCLFTAISQVVEPATAIGTDAYAALKSLVGGSVSHFNDSHSHAEVLDLFDRAIGAVE